MKPHKEAVQAAQIIRERISFWAAQQGTAITWDNDTLETIITDCYRKSAEYLLEAQEALRALPLEDFGDDMGKCDATDFIEHAGQLFVAIQKAKALLAKHTERT